MKYTTTIRHTCGHTVAYESQMRMLKKQEAMKRSSPCLSCQLAMTLIKNIRSEKV